MKGTNTLYNMKMKVWSESEEDELYVRGMDLLFDGLGEIEALRFLIIYNSRLYNYTEWHEHLWEDKSVDEIASMCRELERERTKGCERSSVLRPVKSLVHEYA
jgi:hypothetical protein